MPDHATTALPVRPYRIRPAPRRGARATAALRGPVLVALLSVLAGCTDFAGLPVAPPPAPPERAAAGPPARPATEAQADTRDPDLMRYYAQVEADLRARGLLRTDLSPDDAPFDAAQLAQTFERIVFFSELTARGGGVVRRPTAFPLQRWQDPVRIGIYAGPGVPPDRARQVRTSTGLLMTRIRRVTGHPIDLGAADPNFHVIVATEPERRALAPLLRQLAPGVPATVVDAVTGLSRSDYCAVFALEGDRPNVYRTAVVVIRAELPDLLSRSCLHEEIAQGFGLANDWPRARPSIFNDDEEFALLTRHDELLLRILYDPRLTPGMTADRARPLVLQIAAERLGGSS